MDKKDLGFIKKSGELIPVLLDPQELELKDKNVTHRKKDKPKNFSFRYDAARVIQKLTTTYKVRYRLYKIKIKTDQHKNPRIRELFKSHEVICEVGAKNSSL